MRLLEAGTQHHTDANNVENLPEYVEKLLADPYELACASTEGSTERGPAKYTTEYSTRGTAWQ